MPSRSQMSVAPEEPAVHDVGPIFAGRKTFRFEYKGSTLRIFDQMGFFVFVAKRKYGLPRHSFTLFYAPTRERVAKLKAKVSVRRHAWNLYICGTKYAKLRQLSNGKTVRFEIELISHARENISIYGSWTSNGWVIHRYLSSSSRPSSHLTQVQENFSWLMKLPPSHHWQLIFSLRSFLRSGELFLWVL